jgi:hypothetical protein
VQIRNQPCYAVSGFVHEQKLRFKLFPAAVDKAFGLRDLLFAVAETPARGQSAGKRERIGCQSIGLSALADSNRPHRPKSMRSLSEHHKDTEQLMTATKAAHSVFVVGLQRLSQNQLVIR